MNLTFVKIMERKTICQRKTLRVPFLVPWGESFVFRGAGAGSPYAWPGGRGDRSVLPLYKACRFARFFNFIDVFFQIQVSSSAAPETGRPAACHLVPQGLLIPHDHVRGGLGSVVQSLLYQQHQVSVCHSGLALASDGFANAPGIGCDDPLLEP